MSRLVLYKEAQPFVLTQRWGIYDPLYKQFGFTTHNYSPSAGILNRLYLENVPIVIPRLPKHSVGITSSLSGIPSFRAMHA